MWKQHEEGNLITITLTPHLSKLIKYWWLYGASKVKSTQFHCCSKSYWGYWPYSLASQWARNIYSRGFEPLTCSCWFFLRNPILFFFNFIYQCAEMNRWLFLQQQMCKFENVSFFLKVSDEEKFLLFQYDEINGKSAMLSYWYAWCKNADSW